MLKESYLSTEKKSVYSTALAEREIPNLEGII